MIRALAFSTTVLLVLGVATRASASDELGGNAGTSVGATAGGGQVTVAAGTGSSAPPSGGGPDASSEGGTSAGSAPDPYECTYTAASPKFNSFLDPEVQRRASGLCTPVQALPLPVTFLCSGSRLLKPRAKRRSIQLFWLSKLCRSLA